MSNATASLAFRVFASILCAALLCSAGGCSLISLKSPEKPLSTRDLNARILTREYSSHFIAAVAQTADNIASADATPDTRNNALRWKIAAANKSLRAAGQMAPMMGLLDTWALSVQMSDYLTTGAGATLFGAHQVQAAALAADLSKDAQNLARRLTATDEFARDQQFIDGYARDNPLESLHFTRPSIVESWTRRMGSEIKLVDSLGTVPEALADTGDRLRMYGDAGPEQLLWQAQLAAQQSGVTGEDLHDALRRLDERMGQVSTMVSAAPKLVDGVVRDAGIRFDTSWAEMMRDVRAEEVTVSSTLSTERQATLDALDLERAALAADAARITNQVVRDAGDQVRRMVREALVLAILLALVVLGLPFGAGYFVGRATRRG